MTIKKQSALALQLAGQLVKHYVGPQNPEGYEKETNIVTARNGIFRVIKTPVAILKTQIAKMEKDAVVPGPAEMQEGAELLIPKIPFKYWLMVLKFYRDIHTKDKTEASVLYFWNTNNVSIPKFYNPSEAQVKLGIKQGSPINGLIEDGQLIVYCPTQKNSSGLSEFHTDGMVNWLREHTTPLLETHSHHTMGAFFSGTDDANENMNQFYAVYGQITKAEPAFIFRFCSGQHKVVYDPSVLFDFPRVKISTTTTREFVVNEGAEVEGFEPVVETEEKYEAYNGPWPDVDYPDDWMGQHTRAYVYTPPAKTGYTGYGGYAGTGAAGLHGDYGDGGWDGYGAAASYGYGTEKPLKKNEQEEEGVIETGTSIVEIQAKEIIDQLTTDQIKQLVYEISDFGYDYLIAEALEEVKFRR